MLFKARTCLHHQQFPGHQIRVKHQSPGFYYTSCIEYSVMTLTHNLEWLVVSLGASRQTTVDVHWLSEFFENFSDKYRSCPKRLTSRQNNTISGKIGSWYFSGQGWTSFSRKSCRSFFFNFSFDEFQYSESNKYNLYCIRVIILFPIILTNF